MSIYEGSIVYIRARATKRATFYENGTAVEGVMVVQPITNDGVEQDYIRVPPQSVVSAQAAEIAIRRKIENEKG